MRVAVIGHVEHITLGRVPRVPRAGEIAHAEQVRTFPGGGGGIAFFQLAKSPGEVHLFTAVGADEAAEQVRSRVESTGARIHLAHRTEPHTRDLVLITPDGERTIVVLGEPLHPEKRDALPWDVLSSCHAAYFTAQDPEALRAGGSRRPRGRAGSRRLVPRRRGADPTARGTASPVRSPGTSRSASPSTTRARAPRTTGGGGWDRSSRSSRSCRSRSGSADAAFQHSVLGGDRKSVV